MPKQDVRKLVKKGLKDTMGKEISVSWQCALLGVSRGSVYYHRRECSEAEQVMMREMDSFSLEHPTAGVRTHCSHLCRQGHSVGLKRVRRLMRQMGMSAIYPQKSLSKPGAAVYRAPYLLRGFKASQFGQVWSVDISYIAMSKGFMYMVSIIDVYREVL